MKKYPIIISLVVIFLALSILSFSETSIKNDFQMNIISENHDLLNHEVIFEIKNYQDINRYFDLEFYLKNLNFDMSKVSDVYMYEWKPVAVEVPTYDVRLIKKDCYDNVTEKTYDCSYNETYQNGTITKNLLDWKPTKMALITQIDKVSTDYGNINIPKATSKCSFDDNGVAYDCNGTKRFKITWKTPIVKTNNGWGSTGYYALADKNSGIDYDPWWNTSFLYRRNITINNTANSNTLTDFQVPINITYDSDMQSDFDDLRFANLDGTTELSYWIENKSNSNWAYVWVKVNAIQANSNTTIQMYYGNPTATSKSNISTTFLLGDDFSSNTIGTVWSTITSGSGSIGISGGVLSANVPAETGFTTQSVKSSYTFQLPVIVKTKWRPTAIHSGDSASFRSDAIKTSLGDYISFQYSTAVSGFKFYVSGIGWINPAYSGWTQNTNWNILDIIFKLNSGNLTMNNSKVLNASWSTQTAYTVSITFGVGQSSSSTGASAEFDWVFLRKYTSPEPNICSIGSEEQLSNAPTSIQLWLNDQENNITITYGTSLNATAQINVTGLWVAIEKNGTLIANGTTTSTSIEIWEAGYHQIKAYYSGNDSYSPSEKIYYATISKATPTCTLDLSPTSPITYETQITATCSCSNTDSGVSVKLYRNSTDVTSQNNTPIYLPAGVWNYVCNSTETANYTSETTNSNYVVNKKDANVKAYPTTQTITYGTSVNQYCTDNSDLLNCNLYRNNTPISNNTIIVLGAGTYVYKANISDISNYTNYEDTQILTVNKATPNMNFTITPSNVVTEGTIVNITCNYPSEITATLYNDTGAISNPFIFDTAGKVGTWNYTCNTTGNDNYTARSINTTVTVGITGGLVILAVYDEKTLAPLTFNLSIYNSTFSATENNINSYNNNSVKGDLTLVISASGYVPRNYYVYVPFNESVSMTGYLLKSTDGVYVTYWAYSSSNPTGEYNSYHVFKRFIGSGYVTVVESKADLEGKGTVFLDPYTNYVINSQTADGSLTWNSSSYNPNPSFILKINFGSTAGTGTNITWLFSNTNYSLTPTDIYLRLGSGGNTTTFNYTIQDGNDAIEWLSLRLIYYNGTELYFSNDSTHPSGNSITVNLNYTNLKNYIIAETLMKKTGYDVFGANRTYIIWESTSAIPEALEYVASSGINPPILALIAVFASFGVAMISNRWIRTGSGLIYLGVLTIFGLYNFFPLGMILGLFLLEVGILMYMEVW